MTGYTRSFVYSSYGTGLKGIGLRWGFQKLGVSLLNCLSSLSGVSVGPPMYGGSISRACKVSTLGVREALGM